MAKYIDIDHVGMGRAMSKHIDVDELKEWVSNWFEKNRYYHPYSRSNDIPIPELYDILEQMPPAQQEVGPERKIGKWILNREGNWACPFCGFDPYHDEMNGMNYCPNCGARLEGFDNGKVH